METVENALPQKVTWARCESQVRCAKAAKTLQAQKTLEQRNSVNNPQGKFREEGET